MMSVFLLLSFCVYMNIYNIAAFDNYISDIQQIKYYY